MPAGSSLRATLQKPIPDDARIDVERRGHRGQRSALGVETLCFGGLLLCEPSSSKPDAPHNEYGLPTT